MRNDVCINNKNAEKKDFAAKTHSLPLRVLPLALEGEFLAVAHCKVIIKRLIPTFLHSLLYYHRRLVDVKMRNDVCGIKKTHR